MMFLGQPTTKFSAQTVQGASFAFASIQATGEQVKTGKAGKYELFVKPLL